MNMPPKEHLLILSLFTKQNQFIKVLLDILKSRGILDSDDARAFECNEWSESFLWTDVQN